MNSERYATVDERCRATVANIFVGTIPIWAPNAIYTFGLQGSWTKNDSILDATSIGLSVVQFILFWRMQGSMGFVCTGLRVQRPGGGLPLKASVLRALPYMAFTAVFIVMPRPGSNERMSSYAWAMAGLFTACALVLASGFVLLRGGRGTLLDRISGTQVVKI
jgi:hypothetical protein